jgi:gas vesicle protein
MDHPERIPWLPWKEDEMRNCLRGWMFGVGLAAVIGLAGTLHADARDDLSRVKSDYDSVKSHYDSAKSKLESYLDESVKLRQMDKDQLNELITRICKLDEKRDDDEADRLAKELKDKIVDRVKSEYEHTVDDGSHVFDDLGRLEGEAKSVRDRAKDLESKDEVKSDAERLRQDIENTQQAIQKLFERINADRATLERVKEGVMNGANNPMIRARMEYGKDMHKKMQDSFSCNEREAVLSSGRPDCVKFESEDCQVLEFKPDTYSESDAESQAKKYLNDVRDKFKGDDRAKKCKWNSDGPIFRAVGKTYEACRVP